MTPLTALSYRLNEQKSILAQEIVNRRGRGFASNEELWAHLRKFLDELEDETAQLKKLHKELWGYVKEGNEDAVNIYLHDIEHASMETSATAMYIAASTLFDKTEVVEDE